MELTAEQVRALGERGWFVADGFMGAPLVREARRQALLLATGGSLVAAGIRRGAAHSHDPQVRSDRITWLGREDLVGDLAQVWEHFETLRSQLNREAYLGLTRFELQLGWYPANGACYARHRDAFPGSDNRRVTALVYLNEGWLPEHGGRLRLHVEPPCDLNPIGDRCVVFLSERVEHEVLPSFADRFAIAAWFSR
jgi:SM-20-related protein